MALTFVDVFCGAGGFGLGFREASARPVRLVDWWEAARDCHARNGDADTFELVDLFNSAEVSRLGKELAGATPDVVIGGPPCQGFSPLGKVDSLDRRNGLVFAYLELVARIAPRVFLMENVKTMATTKMEGGRRFRDVVIDYFRDGHVGYSVYAYVLKGTDFGMAQTRERVFFLGIRDDIEHDVIAISRKIDTFRRPAMVLSDVIRDLPRIGPGGGAEQIVVSGRTIWNHRAMPHGPELVERFRHIPPGGGLRDVPAELLTPHLRRMRAGEYGSGGGIKNIYGRMEWNRPSGTIVAGMDKITCGRFVHPEDHRLLSVRECARIQSFPDDFTFGGGLVTQYYLVGNAVPPALSRIWAKVVTETVLSGRRRAARRRPPASAPEEAPMPPPAP